MRRLPPLQGEPIRISARPELSAHRGKLLSSHTGRGVPVHAACFLRAREIVLETALFASPRTLRLILVHEIFHFVWFRLSNQARSEFAELLRSEFAVSAKGELGESAGVKKSLIAAGQPPARDFRLWRDYVSESFCDTAAWLYAGVGEHSWFRLAKRWRERRRAWFDAAFEDGCRC